MKNWKSTLAFFIFIGVYVFTVWKGKDSMVESAGYIALYSSLFMMLRNEMTGDILTKLVDGIGKSK